MNTKLLESIPSGSLKSLSSTYFPLLLGVLSGVSVFYFLYFFEAYGIQRGLSYSGHSHLFRSISFGLLTFLYLGIAETWVKPEWVSTPWSRQIIWYGGLIILGSHLIFLLFNFFWNWQEWNLLAYGLIMKEFPLMMVLPLSMYLVVKALVKPDRKSEETYLVFQSDNGKDVLKLREHHFLYAKSSENYITIIYRSNGHSKQHIIRKPLKVLENELDVYPSIVRTHRSFLVNRQHIDSIKQLKGKVFIEIDKAEIPISRQFQDQFLV